MNFSSEEIFSMYGQFDTFVSLEFVYNSEEYKTLGHGLMGVFLYTLDERQEIELLLKKAKIPRTDGKIKFSPSSLEKLSEENLEILDRCGIQASSINVISSLNGPRKNRFSEKGVKQIPNHITIQAPKISGWQELNQLQFGFLNRIYKDKQPFTPFQEIEYWGLRKHLGIALDNKDYLEIVERHDITKDIRLVELEAKFQELIITEDEMKEFATLIVEKISFKDKVINEEIKKSSENIKSVQEYYKTEIGELKKCCYAFDEEVLLYGSKPIYLTFERFVHMYARHVAETQIGERFAGQKTVFQYKLEDLKYLIKMVVDAADKDIYKHFLDNPNQQFRRIGKRAIYIDGHYYRLVIDPDGSIQDFHPYNQAED